MKMVISLPNLVPVDEPRREICNKTTKRNRDRSRQSKRAPVTSPVGLIIVQTVCSSMG